MLFWLVALLIAAAVAAALLAPLLRQREEGGARPELAVYRDQLAEIDRDLARGTLPPDEAERARTEVARRLLAADRAGPAPERPAPAAATRLLIAAVIALTLAGGLGLYWREGAPGYPDIPLAGRLAAAEAMRAARPSQAEAEAAVAAAGGLPAPEADAEYLAMIAQLRAAVAGRPEDLRGHELLALHEARLGNYAAAARAQQRVIELKGFDVTPEDYAALADRLVAAADGYVSPEAEEVLRALLAAAPEHPAGLYYTGLLYAQTDRPDIAFRLWRPLAEGDPAAPYARLARGLIGEAAMRAGVDYALPEGPGPTAADIEAAAGMDAEAQAAMIRGMVGRLASRLATQGGPAEDWAQLIRAQGVLGETESAAAIWAEAREVFAGDAAALALLAEAAAGAGLSE